MLMNMVLSNKDTIKKHRLAAVRTPYGTQVDVDRPFKYRRLLRLYDLLPSNKNDEYFPMHDQFLNSPVY